jgi:hypothetical protein
MSRPEGGPPDWYEERDIYWPQERLDFLMRMLCELGNACAGAGMALSPEMADWLAEHNRRDDARRARAAWIARHRISVRQGICERCGAHARLLCPNAECPRG